MPSLGGWDWVILIALILLAAQIGGIIFCNEGAHFLLEGQFFGAEFKIHG